MQRDVQPPRVIIARPQSARPNALGRGTSSYGRHIYAPTTPFGPGVTSTCLHPIRPLISAGKRPSSAIGSRRCSEIDTANMYHVVVARKDAEETAKQLARRIAHFRSQEERVLREMQAMRSQLEVTLAEPQEQRKPPDPAPDRAASGLSAPCTQLRLRSRSTAFVRPETHREVKPEPETSKADAKRKPKASRVRDQLQFLTKQKRVLQTRKREEARQQKEKLKVALAEQKAKEAELKKQKRSQKERIRTAEQQALEQRTAKQQQLREAREEQQRERLQAERQRQQDALHLIHEMQEEERNLGLRLEALRFHQEHIKQNLRDTSPHHKPQRVTQTSWS